MSWRTFSRLQPSMVSVAGPRAGIEADNHFRCFFTGQITATGKASTGSISAPVDACAPHLQREPSLAERARTEFAVTVGDRLCAGGTLDWRMPPLGLKIRDRCKARRT